MSSRSSVVSSSLLSLLEASRQTGIPMPTILRLRRENAEAIPSTGSGSQRYFSPDVLPTLLELYQKVAQGSDMFLSILRPHVPSQKGRPAKSAKTARSELSKQMGVSRDSDQNLADRIERLEIRQQALCREIVDLLDWLSLPAEGIARWS